MIWLLLAVPIVASTVTAAIPRWRHRIVWWELALPTGAAAAVIGVAYLIAVNGATSDIEYWGGWVRRAEFIEEWSERVTYTETHTDAKGHTHVTVKTRIDHHGPEWNVETSNGEVVGTDRTAFEELCRQFGMRKFEDVWRACEVDDGDMYYTEWDGRDTTLEPTCVPHTYQNRVQATRSLMSYPEVTAQQVAAYGLWSYPSIWKGYRHHSALGITPEADRRLNYWNAILGSKHRVRIFLLGFKGQPREAGALQEAYWKGGNKNEFVVCVGLDAAGRASWSHVFSWTEAEDAKVVARDAVVGWDGEDWAVLIDTLAREVGSRYRLVPWEKFDYLAISPGPVAVAVAAALVLITSGSCIWFVLQNGVRETGEGTGNPYFPRWHFRARRIP